MVATPAAPLGAAPKLGTPHQLLASSPAARAAVPQVGAGVAPRHPAAPAPGAGADLGADAPLELAHVLGINGAAGHCAVYHPTADPPVCCYGVGCLVVLRQLDDAHQQTVLRGHDAPVTALDCSPSGALLVSGQAASAKKEGRIVVWDYAAAAAVYQLRGHAPGGVLCVRFSPDDRWVASTGEDGRLHIWDMQNGSCAGGVKDASLEGERATCVSWGEVFEAGTRRQAYELTAAYNSGVRGLRWGFDVRSLQYTLSQRAFQVPGAGGKQGGFLRQYRCSALLPSGELLCGTASGDVVVYGVKQGLYRTSFTVSSAGALSICSPPGAGATVFVGAGDGRLRRIGGGDRDWALQQEVQLYGGVTSLSSSQDGAELVAATSAGMLYRVLAADMTYTVVGEAHTAGVCDAAAPHGRSDRFATCSADGSVRVWDLSEYSTVCRYDCRPHLPRCLSWSTVDHDVLVTGWSDGSVRALDTREYHCPVAWQMANAHRGAVTCARATDTYLLTAGEDGVVRVWTTGGRECVASLQDHKRAVTDVLVDNTTSRIVHSTSADRCLLSYDLSRRDGHNNSRQPLRIAARSDTEGAGFTSICQRVDNEHEIIATTADGRLLFYDIDYAQPVYAVMNQARVRANSVALSPQGAFLCVAQADGVLVIYQLQRDAAAGARAIAQARCHSAEAVKATWTADGRQVISVGAEGEVCVWDFFLPA